MRHNYSFIRLFVMVLAIKLWLNQKCYGRFWIISENSKMEIYVGNLPWSTSDQNWPMHSVYGKVEKASIISDRNLVSKGFGL